MFVEKTNTGNKIHGIAYGFIKQVNLDGTFKVWIPGVYGIQFENHPEDLPDAKLLYPLFGTDNDTISIGGPLVEGTRVFCIFENGEITNPIIIGKYYSWASYKSIASKTQTSMDNQLSFRNGNSVLILKESGTIEIFSLEKSTKEDTPKAKITLTNTGNISIEGTDISINAFGNLIMSGDKVEINSTSSDIVMTAKANINMNAANILMKVIGFVKGIKAAIQKILFGLL